MHWDVLGEVLGDVAAATVVGRVFLAWLPAGRLGSFAPRDLPVTWAVSWVLGTVVRDAYATLDAAVGLPELGLLVATAVLLALKLATRPAGLVPGRDVPGERVGLAAHAIGAATAALFAWELTDLLTDPLPPAPRGLFHDWFGAAALTLLLGHALRTARRSTWERRALLFVFALLALRSWDVAERASVLFGGGAALAVAWWRRADARALAVSALALGDAGLQPAPDTSFSMAWIAGSLAALVLVTPAAARRRALAWGAAGLLFVLAQPLWPYFRMDCPPDAPAPGWTQTFVEAVRHLRDWTPVGIAATWVVGLAAATVVLVRGPARHAPAPERELLGAGLAVGLTAAAAAVASTGHFLALTSASRGLVPGVFLFVGLALLRPERASA